MVSLDDFSDSIRAIQDDKELRQTFIEVLKFGTMTQQVRVARLHELLAKQNAPANLLHFVGLLKNEILAHAVLKALEAA